MMAGGDFLQLSVDAYSVKENWIHGTSVVTHTCALLGCPARSKPIWPTLGSHL